MRDTCTDIKMASKTLNMTSGDKTSSSGGNPQLYSGNNKVHGVTISKPNGDSRYISGKVLTEYKYKSSTDTFIKLPSMKLTGRDSLVAIKSLDSL